MVTIRIGSAQTSLEEMDEGWVNQQLSRRHADGFAVCVQVSISEPEVTMSLSTPQCAGGGGGGRLPNQRERRILELWSEHRLNGTDYTGGNLIAFLRQLRRLV